MSTHSRDVARFVEAGDGARRRHVSGVPVEGHGVACSGDEALTAALVVAVLDATPKDQWPL